MIEARCILDSERSGPGTNTRLMTMLTRYPKFIHGEHLRHRAFSFSVSSSRAIPVAKNLEEVRSDKLRASPVWWGKEQKGMSAAEELSYKIPPGHSLSPRRSAELSWKDAACSAANIAEELQTVGAHKSIVNRLLEPFLHVNVLVTGTTDGWLNFFGLRLDKAAQPEIRVLAEEQWRVWNESRPQRLEPGQWHLPFVDQQTWDELNEGKLIPECGPGFVFDHPALKISVARCARLSYQSFETGRRSTIDEDLALYDRLVGSTPIHASPAEHQATPDALFAWKVIESIGGPPVGIVQTGNWLHPTENGNLGPGWRQYRKMLSGESVAPLPLAYRS